MRQQDYNRAQHVLIETIRFITNERLEEGQMQRLRDGAIRIVKGYISIDNSAGVTSMLRAASGLFQTRESSKQLIDAIGREAAARLRKDIGLLISM